jgi:hypothetical protein
MREAACILNTNYALTFARLYTILEHDQAKHQVRVRGDNNRTRWFPEGCFDLAGDALCLKPYTFELEAELWQDVTPKDESSLVFVRFDDAGQWYVDCWTFDRVTSYRETLRTRGEALSGTYFPVSNILIVEEITRECLGPVIADILREGSFEQFFRPCPPEIIP